MVETIKIHAFEEDVEFTSSLTTQALYLTMKDKRETLRIVIPISKIEDLIGAVDILC